jgi:hypothetical protein
MHRGATLTGHRTRGRQVSEKHAEYHERPASSIAGSMALRCRSAETDARCRCRDRDRIDRWTQVGSLGEATRTRPSCSPTPPRRNGKHPTAAQSAAKVVTKNAKGDGNIAELDLDATQIGRPTGLLYLAGRNETWIMPVTPGAGCAE